MLFYIVVNVENHKNDPDRSDPPLFPCFLREERDGERRVTYSNILILRWKILPSSPHPSPPAKSMGREGVSMSCAFN